MTKLLLTICILTFTGCSTPTPSDSKPVPENYMGHPTLTRGLFRELHGSYFNETAESRMVVRVEMGTEYQYEYSSRLYENKLTYEFRVWIGNTQTDFDRAVSDIMATIKTLPEEDWGKLDVGLNYDRGQL